MYFQSVVEELEPELLVFFNFLLISSYRVLLGTTGVDLASGCFGHSLASVLRACPEGVTGGLKVNLEWFRIMLFKGLEFVLELGIGLGSV